MIYPLYIYIYNRYNIEDNPAGTELTFNYAKVSWWQLHVMAASLGHGGNSRPGWFIRGNSMIWRQNRVRSAPGRGKGRVMAARTCHGGKGASQRESPAARRPEVD